MMETQFESTVNYTASCQSNVVNCCICRQFGGFSSRKLIGENLESLHIALDRSRRWYNRTRFYTASYNDPYVTSNRHNEVWVEVA